LELACVEKVTHRRAMLDEHEAVGLEGQALRLAAIRYLDAVPLFGSARSPADVVRPERLIDKLFAGVLRVGDFGLHAAILEWPKPDASPPRLPAPRRSCMAHACLGPGEEARRHQRQRHAGPALGHPGLQD